MNERQSDSTDDLKCPDCRARLKKRRGRRSDECELICGGCGRIFDACDPLVVDRLKKPSA